MDFVKAFVIGGLICVIGQILIDKTNLTPARILVIYVSSGVILSAVGLYGPFAEWAGAGATVPLCGFGNSLCRGVFKAIDEVGWIGIFTGGITATAAGIAAAVVFGYLCAVIFKSHTKR